MTEEFKAYIRALLLACLDITGHSEYDLKLAWSNDDHKNDGGGTSTKMEIEIDIIYLWIKVTVYPQVAISWDNKDFEEIGEFCLHEVCHLLIEPVVDLFMWDACTSQRRQYTDTIERQTERIRKTITSLLRDDWFKIENLEKLGFYK